MCNFFILGRLWEDIKSSSDKSYERTARVITILALGLVFTLLYYIIVAIEWLKKKSPVFNPDISDSAEKVEIFSPTTEEKTTEKPLEEKHDEKQGATKP